MEIYSNLFVYGTLAVPSLRDALIGSCEVLSPAYLPGHRLVKRTDGFPYCLPEEGSWVTGALLNLSQEQWEIIAAWEDAPYDYTLRETVIYFQEKPIYSRFYNGQFSFGGYVPAEGWQPVDLNLMLNQIRDFLFLYKKGKN